MSAAARWVRAVVAGVAIMLVAGCGAVDPTVILDAGAPGRWEDPSVTTTTEAAITSTGVTTTTTRPAATTTTSPIDPVAVESGYVITAAGGTDLAADPGGAVEYRMAAGLTLPILSRSGDQIAVMTSCDTEGWVPAGEVDLVPTWTGDPGAIGPGFDLAAALVVLDPGHGERDWGAVGPTFLAEKELNLDIAIRARTLLLAPHDVDWETGEITEGDTVPALGGVVLTRAPEGPNAGEFEAGLAYRAALANESGADVLVSIHNNAVPQRSLDQPGTEVFYAVSVPGSDRLAGILYEELLLSFSQFDADWKGGWVTGARARTTSDGGDYYGLLRRAEMPAAIAEGVYITNPSEEDLARTAEFRDAYAAAVYRAIVRFLTTDDPGSSINPPEVFTDDAGSASTKSCTVPRQP
jgi:N-acetylmuramoyl-L-alanine amidase